MEIILFFTYSHILQLKCTLIVIAVYFDLLISFIIIIVIIHEFQSDASPEELQGHLHRFCLHRFCQIFDFT